MAAKMDFCSWCVGSREAARRTAEGQTGGICAEHLREQMRRVAELRHRREAQNDDS